MPREPDPACVGTPGWKPCTRSSARPAATSGQTCRSSNPHTTKDIAQFIYDKSHGWFEFIVVPQAWRDAVKKDPPKAKDDGKKADPTATGTAGKK